MILVVNKSNPQTIYIPRNLSLSGDYYDLEITSLVSNYTYVFINLRDEGIYNNWYCFTLDFKTLPNGEYQYKLRSKDNSGLGDFNLDFNSDFWITSSSIGYEKKDLVSYGVLQVEKYKTSTKTYGGKFKQKQYSAKI